MTTTLKFSISTADSRKRKSSTNFTSIVGEVCRSKKKQGHSDNGIHVFRFSELFLNSEFLVEMVNCLDKLKGN